MWELPNIFKTIIGMILVVVVLVAILGNHSSSVVSHNSSNTTNSSSPVSNSTNSSSGSIDVTIFLGYTYGNHTNGTIIRQSQCTPLGNNSYDCG